MVSLRMYPQVVYQLFSKLPSVLSFRADHLGLRLTDGKKLAVMLFGGFYAVGKHKLDVGALPTIALSINQADNKQAS